MKIVIFSEKDKTYYSIKHDGWMLSIAEGTHFWRFNPFLYITLWLLRKSNPDHSFVLKKVVGLKTKMTSGFKLWK